MSRFCMFMTLAACWSYMNILVHLHRLLHHRVKESLRGLLPQTNRERGCTPSWFRSDSCVGRIDQHGVLLLLPSQPSRRGSRRSCTCGTPPSDRRSNRLLRFRLMRFLMRFAGHRSHFFIIIRSLHFEGCPSGRHSIVILPRAESDALAVSLRVPSWDSFPHFLQIFSSPARSQRSSNIRNSSARLEAMSPRLFGFRLLGIIGLTTTISLVLIGLACFPLLAS